jgi:Cu/Ag efflux pump CusA
MTGVRAQVAIKVFGPDLPVLRQSAEEIEEAIHEIPGVVDLYVEPQVEVSQVRLEVDRQAAKEYGLKAGDVATLLETAYKGRVVSQIIDGDRYFDLVVWYEESARNNLSVIGSTMLQTPSGRKVALEQVARVLDTTGPNTINREDGQRRIVVQCNVQGRDLASVVEEIREAISPIEAKLQERSGGYRLELGGQFEAQQQANQLLLVLGLAALAGVFLLLWQALESWRAALQVMVNVPLAAIGSVVALILVHRPSWEELAAAAWWEWPRVWLAESSLSVAHWVGFIALTGIVARNGIMMISHYIHLMKYEGEKFDEKMIVRGTLERLAPVLMTALTAIIALVPLALGAGQTGKEILHPLAIVVIGGLTVSTLLDQVVTPALFYRFGRKIYAGS